MQRPAAGPTRAQKRRWLGDLTRQFEQWLRVQTSDEAGDERKRALRQCAEHTCSAGPVEVTVLLGPSSALDPSRRPQVAIEYIEVRRDARRNGLGVAAIERLREVALARDLGFVVDTVVNPHLLAALERRPTLFALVGDPAEGGPPSFAAVRPRVIL